MSYVLDQGTKPEGVEVKTWNASTLYIHSCTASDEISTKEFLAQAYELLNVPELTSDDPRRVFLANFGTITEIDGWDAGHKRYDLAAYPDYTGCAEGKHVWVKDNYALSLLDFLFTVYYVLTNIDIERNDPRIDFVAALRELADKETA